MEYALLAKVGIIVGGVVKSGYVLASSYLVRTAIRYVKDYRDSVAKDKDVS